PVVDYRSVSQLKQYQKCGYSYYLARIEREWERPAAWLPQGLAVHEAAEEYEKSGRTMSLDKMQDVFQESSAALIWLRNLRRDSVTSLRTSRMLCTSVSMSSHTASPRAISMPSRSFWRAFSYASGSSVSSAISETGVSAGASRAS